MRPDGTWTEISADTQDDSNLLPESIEKLSLEEQVEFRTDTQVHSDDYDAGRTLVDLFRRVIRNRQRNLHDDQSKLLNNIFTKSTGSRVFQVYHIQAVRDTLRSEHPSLARILLERDTTHQLLAKESDLIQIAIVSLKATLRTPAAKCKELIEHLISCGATATGPDDQGYTPIYYACKMHDWYSFELLLHAGVDYSGTYIPLNAGDSSTSPTNQAENVTTNINLLKVALDTWLDNQQHRQLLDTIWHEEDIVLLTAIVLTLFNLGLDIESDDPGLVKLLHVTCYRGVLKTVRKLVGRGVKVNVAGGRSLKWDVVFGSALHAAAAGGQKDVAVYLLEHGANLEPRSVLIPGAGEVGVDLTPVAAALHPKVLRMGTSQPRNFMKDLLDTCEILISEDDGQKDGVLLLEKCISAPYAQAVDRLLRRGFRPDSVPETASLAIAKLLWENRVKFDGSKMMDQAIKRGSLEMVKFLVEESGMQIPAMEFGPVAKQLMDNGHMELLRFLLHESQYTANSRLTPPPAAGCDTLLQLACKPRYLGWIPFFLDEGADPSCPDSSQTALETLAAMVLKNNATSRGWRDAIPAFLVLQARLGDKFDLHGNTISRSAAQELSKFTFNEPMSNRKYVRNFYGGYYSRPEEEVPYSRLVGLATIRIVELEPSDTPDSQIQCRLIEANLTENPEYEALSYVWGDPSVTSSITLQGQPFEVTKNLLSALQRLRLRKEARRLWIDALSINQKDIEERNRQVGMMRDIYARATQAVVWLGDDADDSELVFQYAENRYVGGRTHGPDDATLRAIVSFYQRPWFFRTWVIQEVTVCKKATLICGEHEMAWSELDKLSPSSDSNAFHPVSGVHGPTHLRHLFRIKEFMPRNGDGNPAIIFEYSSLCQATDPRDKVYGLLGLLEAQLVRVDYSKSCAEVFREFTRAVIESRRDIAILHCFGSRRSRRDLNSWVPDYSVSNPVGLLPRAYGSGTYPVGSVFSTLPITRFVDDSLVIKGFKHDTVRSIADELVADASHGPGSKEFARVLRGWETLATELKEKAFARSVSVAFLDTLLAEDRFRGGGQSHYRAEFSDHSMEFLCWYDKYGAGILEKFDSDFFQVVRSVRGWLSEVYSDERIAGDASHYGRAMESVCYGRRFFITERGSMGLASPGARVGDELVYFLGGLYPFLVRPNGNQTYQLVGDCYVYGFARVDVAQSQDSWEDFTLV